MYYMTDKKVIRQLFSVFFILVNNPQSSRSQSSKTWSFYKPACFMTEKKI